MSQFRVFVNGLLAALAGLVIACILNLAIPHAFHTSGEGPEFRRLEHGEIITQKEFEARVRAAEAVNAAAKQRADEMGLGGIFLFGARWYFAIGAPIAVLAFGVSNKYRTLREVLLLATPSLAALLVWTREIQGVFLLILAVAVVLGSKLLMSRRINGAA